MIHIWNRREVFITRSTKDMNNVREILTSYGINYITKTGRLTNTGRHHGILNIKAEYAYEYRMYVHKKDYDFAKSVINNPHNNYKRSQFNV